MSSKELKYKITERKERYGIVLEAEPNQWGSGVSAHVITNEYHPFGTGESMPVPRIGNISWSTGGRTWTVEDARKFFKAGLDLLNRAKFVLEKERKKKARQSLLRASQIPKREKEEVCRHCGVEQSKHVSDWKEHAFEAAPAKGRIKSYAKD